MRKRTISLILSCFLLVPFFSAFPTAVQGAPGEPISLEFTYVQVLGVHTPGQAIATGCYIKYMKDARTSWRTRRCVPENSS